MSFILYQVDTFANKVFEGNPAAVVPLESWLADDVMQAIAAENNLAETAFFIPTKAGFHIRWFTPVKEIALCGHATLASAFVLFNYLSYTKKAVEFDSLSGVLRVTQEGDTLQLDFPNQAPTPCALPDQLIASLGVTPEACFESEDLMVLLENDTQLKAINPDFQLLIQLPLRGVIVTAPSADYDFVARFFAPKYGIPEDPVTGSAYTQLAPFWAERLSKTRLKAKQLSARGGELTCTVEDDRVLIAGRAVLYCKGEIFI